MTMKMEIYLIKMYGTNYIMFREVRPDVDIEKLFDKIYNNEPISKATLNRYTRSLRRYVKQIYGW